MTIPGNLLTTAMAVMPHTNVDQALEAALSLDVPFWPQLPNFDYHEDMYVQAAEHFPRILMDMGKKGIPLDQILDQSMLSPATCCLVNEDREKTVEKAFRLTNMLSQNLREQYKLI